MNIHIGYMGKLGIEPISPRKKALYPPAQIQCLCAERESFYEESFLGQTLIFAQLPPVEY